MRRERGEMAAQCRAEAEKHPGESPTEIAKRVPGATRQIVESALLHSGRMGRPGSDSRTLRLSSMLLDAVEALADESGDSSREWVEDAITQKMSRARRGKD